jgi:hypothetical protein
MAEPENIPQEVKGRIEQIGSADLVIGLPGCHNGDAVMAAAGKVQTAFESLSPALKIVMMHSDGVAIPNSDLSLLSFPNAANQDVFIVSRLLGAKACEVMGSDLDSVTPETIRRLSQPVLEQNSDFVVACYSRHKFDGLINCGIAYPLIRALYGKRVQWPMARDFGFSGRAIERFVLSAGGNGSPASMVTEAVIGGLQVSQTNLAAQSQPSKGSSEVSSVLAEVLNPIFLDVERKAPFWQKIRGSQAVPTFGFQSATTEESAPVDVSRLIETFRLGFRDLGEVWNLILPPATMLGLKKLTDQPADRFRIQDELWARIVYDFALGFRLRVMNRDHLLRALTPLYLAWVASYALEMQSANPDDVDERIERLCAAYEAQKPYLQSRWRWPDRFNP